jgi:hypothetical protein
VGYPINVPVNPHNDASDQWYFNFTQQYYYYEVNWNVPFASLHNYIPGVPNTVLLT